MIAIYAESNANVADLLQLTTHSNADIIHIGYWAIGPDGGVIEITGRVADPQPKDSSFRPAARGYQDLGAQSSGMRE